MEALYLFLDLVLMFGAFYAVSGLRINVGTHWHGNETLTGPLIVEHQELVVYYKISTDDPSNSDSETNRALGHTFVSLGLVPSITISNSTWSQTYSFGKDVWKPELGYWEMHLPCKLFTCREAGVVNVGEWYGIVEMDVNTGLLRKVVSIIDFDTEPIHFISEAMSVLSPPLPGMSASSGRLVSSQSPCSPDVVLIASISHDSGVHVGISFESLQPYTLQWFDLTTILCFNTSSRECNPGRLIDFKLTSEYFVVLTSEGIFTIHLTEQRLNKDFVNLINIESVTEGTSIDDTRLFYTPTCNADHLLDEVVLLVEQLPYPDTTAQILAVSRYPFTSWSPLNLTDGVPVLGLHLPQSSRLLILTKHEDQHLVSLYPQDQVFGPQGSSMKPVYAPKVIPSSFIPHGACLDTTGYHSFFYGNQIYRSYDSISFHLLVTLSHGDYITTCATSINHHTTVFLSHSNNIFIAKTGIPDRIVKATESVIVHRPSILFIDNLGDVYAGGITDNDQQTWIKFIDITALIEEASHIVQAPITIQHITATRFILWQEEEDHHDDDHDEDDDDEDDDDDETDDEDDIEDKNVLNKTVVGQEIVGSGFRLLITNMRSLSGGTMVAMATSQEPSLHANMRTPDIAEGVNDLLLKESPCQHVMIPHPSVAKQPTVYMDVGDTFTFQVSASYVGIIGQSEKAMMSIQVTNPSLIHVKTTRTYNRFGMETAVITVRHKEHNKGVSSILINIPSASLQCNSVFFALTIHCTCPPTKRLHFVYDPPVTAQDYFYGSPKNRKNQSLLHTLDVNYRPPSRLGISVPLTSNIYNADPGLPRLHDHYEVSKASGFYKQCAGKQSIEECQCTDEMKLSSLELFTDCRKKVYRITYTEDLYPHLMISERGKEDYDLDVPYILTLEEVNDREDYVIEAAKVEYMPEIAKIVGIPVNLLHSPNQLVVKFLSIQLYHFRLKVIDGFSYCTLEDEFQIFVDRAPLPGLSQMIIFVTVSALMGGVVFVIYLNYIRKSQIHRTRSMMLLFEKNS